MLTCQNSNAVHAIIRSAIQSFLARHGLHVGEQDNLPLHPTKREKLELPSHAIVDERIPQLRTQPTSLEELEKRYYESRSQLNIDLPDPQSRMIESGALLWTDSKTGHAYIIDQRTGNSHLQGSEVQKDQEPRMNDFDRPRNQKGDLNGVNNPKQDTPEWIYFALAVGLPVESCLRY